MILIMFFPQLCRGGSAGAFHPARPTLAVQGARVYPWLVVSIPREVGLQSLSIKVEQFHFFSTLF